MKLPRRAYGKTDPALSRLLRAAQPTKLLTAVLAIDAGEDASVVYRKDYATYPEYTAALDRRRQRLGQRTGHTLDRIARLGLTVYGGKSPRFAVVTGPAAALAEALARPDVLHATPEETATEEER